MAIIKIQTSDKEIIEVDAEIAKCSLVISDMVKNFGLDEDVISLPKVKCAILKQVIKWATYRYENSPSPDDDGSQAKRIETWENNFLAEDLDYLYELIWAAEYLQINGLVDCACKKVAKIIGRNQSVEDIRNTFNIKSKPTPTEELELFQKNMGCSHDLQK